MEANKAEITNAETQDAEATHERLQGLFDHAHELVEVNTENGPEMIPRYKAMGRMVGMHGSSDT